MFEKKDFSQILETMQNSLQKKSDTQFDFEEGSVVGTLFESFAYEMAVLYEQMERVYLSAYVDSAEDTDLDKVVAILGIKRGEPEYATGKVTFSRDVGIDEEIEIPINTLITTEDTDKSPKQAYKTIELRTILPGESAVTVRIQAEDFGKAGETPAETIVVMPQPVPGVKSVNNSQPIQFTGKEREKDEELRDRAKETLIAASGANATSISNALMGMPGVREVKIKEPFDNAASQSESGIYGLIDVFVDAADFEAIEPQLQSRIERVRAAGVYVRLTEPTKVDIDVIWQITVDPKLKFAQASERRAFESTVESAMENYLKQLTIGQPLVYTQLIRQLLSISGVDDLNEVAIAVFKGDRRTEYTLAELAQNKQIAVTDTEKIVARRLRVTSAAEKLPVTISLQFQFEEAEITKADLVEFFNDYFSKLKEKVTKEGILTYIKKDDSKIKEKQLTIVEDSLKLFLADYQQVDAIEISYLEQAQTDEHHLFAYSKILDLIGAVKFTPPNPISTEEKQNFQSQIRKQIELYLNKLQPQAAIDINDLQQEIQQALPTLAIANFVPEDFRVGEKPEIKLDQNKIIVGDFEKVRLGSFCITNTTENVAIEVTQLQLTIQPVESDRLATQVSEAIAEEVNKAIAQAEEIANKASNISDKIKQAIPENLSDAGSTVEKAINNDVSDSATTPTNSEDSPPIETQTPTLGDDEQKRIKEAAVDAIAYFDRSVQGENLVYQSFKQTIEDAVNSVNVPTLKSVNYQLQVTQLSLEAESNSDRRQTATIDRPQDIHIRSVEVIRTINPPSLETIEIVRK